MPSIALDGAAAIAEHWNLIAESVDDGRTLLLDIRFTAGATLDPGPLEHKPLRLAGDRVR
jgi:hypothetical protein